jgi:hypothetical protein
MKSFLIEYYDTILTIFALTLMFFVIVLIFISYVFNKKRYTKIVELYIERFGRLPHMARLARYGSLIGTPGVYYAKVGFIMWSLIFPYNRVVNNNMSIEAYEFIRNLPKELTTGFKVEAILSFFIAGIFLILLSMVIFFK